MKKQCKIICILVLSLSLAVTAFAEKEEISFFNMTLLSAPYGHGGLEGDFILGNLISTRDPWLRLHPQESPGYVYNIREMGMRKSRWSNTTFGSSDGLLAVAASEEPIVKKMFFPKPINVDWKFLYCEGIWTQGFWMATLNPKIKSLADLKGKKIGMGLPTQSHWGMHLFLVLKYGYGINEENSTFEWLGPMKATEALLDGRVDAACMGGAMNIDETKFFPAPPVRTLEAANRPVYWLVIGDDALAKINKVIYHGIVKYRTIPANSIPYQPEPMKIATDIGYKTVAPSFDEKAAYTFVKSVATLGPTMTKVSGFWKLWSPRQMMVGLTEKNTHPGAIKAYKELGWWGKYNK